MYRDGFIDIVWQTHTDGRAEEMIPAGRWACVARCGVTRGMQWVGAIGSSATTHGLKKLQAFWVACNGRVRSRMLSGWVVAIRQFATKSCARASLSLVMDYRFFIHIGLIFLYGLFVWCIFFLSQTLVCTFFFFHKWAMSLTEIKTVIVTWNGQHLETRAYSLRHGCPTRSTFVNHACMLKIRA